MRIQHNITALSAYRNLTNNNSMVAKNLEKLSSGYRINRAGDDAAGLAISEKMRAQITGLETAQKNANDGISLIQTAEGALTEVHSMLNRMVELANQSANGTYQDEDRANLQAEVKALQDEINRISEGTNFNGINLLDGSLSDGSNIKTIATIDTAGMLDAASNLGSIKDGELGVTGQRGVYTMDLSQLVVKNPTAAGGDAAAVTFTIGSTGNQVGFKAADGTTAISLGKVNAGGYEMTGAEIAKKLDGSNITIDDITYDVTADGAKLTFTARTKPTSDYNPEAGFKGNVATIDDKGKVNQGDQFSITPQVEAIPDGTRVYGQAAFSFEGASSALGATGSTISVEDGKVLKIGNESYIFAVGANSKFKDAVAEGAKIIDLTDQTAGNVDAKVAADRLAMAAKDNKTFIVGSDKLGNITLTEREGGVDYSVNNLAGDNGKSPAGSGAAGAADDADTDDWKNLIQLGTATAKKEVPDKPGSSLTLQIGDTSDAFNKLTVNIESMSSKALGIGDIDISTQAGANAAVDKIKAAINQVSSQRGDLGALQNRLEHTINNLSVTTENMTAAESRIRDVDMAKEMMAYTKNNILVQASQAMLAQANQIPQGVLQLLQ